MKKFAIPMLIGLILTAFCLTSCGETPILAEEDTWYEFSDITIKNNKVTIYALYSSNGLTSSGKTIDPGLTFIISAETGVASGVNVNTYEMKNFPKNETIVTESEGAKKSITANATTMDTLYVAGRASKKTTFKGNVTPKPFTDNYVSTDNILSIFDGITSWKQLVKELVNTLL